MVSGVIGTYGVPTTDKEWREVRRIARQDLEAAGFPTVDTKMLNAAVSEHKQKMPAKLEE